MPRVTKTYVRPRPTLAQRANQQARAEYAPQIRGVRRDVRGQVGSLRSMERGLQGSLGIARRNIRRAGLQGDDLRLALRELAFRSQDVGAGTALQIQTARQEGRGQIQDLLASQGQARSSLLGEMQAAAQERRQEIGDAARDRVEDLKFDVLKEAALKQLGLGSYAGSGGDGLTPTQRRGERDSRQNARFYAKQYFDASREIDGIPDDPAEWDESTWRGLAGKVAEQKGVDNVEDAMGAVRAIRDHFTPGGEDRWGSLLGSLGTLGRVIAPPLASAALGALSDDDPRRRRRR